MVKILVLVTAADVRAARGMTGCALGAAAGRGIRIQQPAADL
jgi:hypothetical protein